MLTGAYPQEHNFLVEQKHFSQECHDICYVACGFDININGIKAIVFLSFDCISLVNQ